MIIFEMAFNWMDLTQRCSFIGFSNEFILLSNNDFFFIMFLFWLIIHKVMINDNHWNSVF